MTSSSSTPEFRAKLTLDPSDYNIDFDKAEARAEAYSKRLADIAAQSSTSLSSTAAQFQKNTGTGLAAVAQGTMAAANASRFTRQELLALNYTASDVAASLASGMSPLTILLQQGPQVRDAFGGLPNVFSKVAGALGPIGAAAAAIAATVGVLGTAYYKGTQEQDRFNRSMVLTGNYAGMTNDRLGSLARAAAERTASTIGSSREMVAELAATGRIGGAVIDSFTATALRYEKVSDKTRKEVISSFVDMASGPTKWAEEANKSMHFVSNAQLQYIARLEEQGQTEKAQLEVSRLLYDHLGGDAVQNLGLLERAARSTASGLSSLWDSMLSIGREDTFGEKVARLEAAIKKNRELAAEARSGATPAFGNMRAQDFDARADQQQTELARTRELQWRELASANDRAARLRLEERAIVAQKAVDALNDQVKGQTLLNKKIEEYRGHIAALRANGDATPSTAEQEAAIAKLREQYNPKAGQAESRLASAVRERLEAYGQERAQLTQQIEQYAKYGRAIDATTRTVLDFDLAQGKLKGTSAAQAARLRREADEIDAQKIALAATQEAERIDRRIEKIGAASAAQAMNNRESRIAQELAAIDEKKIPVGTALYEQKAAAIRKEVNADEDLRLARRLRQQSTSVDEDIARLDQETASLMQNALQRQIAVYAIKLEAEARKELLNSPDKAAEIDAAKAADLERYTAAATRNFEAQRSGMTGLQQAIARYRDDVGNVAGSTRSLVEKTFGGIEDSLVSMATTGKANGKELVNSLLAEFVRLNAVRPLLASLVGGMAGAGGGGSLLAGLVGSMIGGSGLSGMFGTSGTASLASSMGGDSLNNFLALSNNFAGARAAGGDVEPGRRYLVGEYGPEPFVPRVAGTILPARALAAQGGPQVVLNQTIHVAAGATRNEVVQAGKVVKAETLAEVQRLLRKGVIG